MALRDALGFLQWVRRDITRSERLRGTPSVDLAETLVQMGRKSGYLFTLAELQAAFARDCTMRWLRYGRRTDDGAENV